MSALSRSKRHNGQERDFEQGFTEDKKCRAAIGAVRRLLCTVKILGSKINIISCAMGKEHAVCELYLENAGVFIIKIIVTVVNPR